jgi:membrane-bound lytic murein transglycosylase A
VARERGPRTLLNVRRSAVVIVAVAVLAACRGKAEEAPAPDRVPAPAVPSTPGAIDAAVEALAVAGPTAAATSAIAAAAVPMEPPPCPRVVPRPPPPIDRASFAKATWDDLVGWKDDRLSEAVPSFLRSCQKIGEMADDAWVGLDHRFGRAKHWRQACAAASVLPAGDDIAARRFFESEMAPWQVKGKGGPVGKMTAYYVQQLRASRTRHGPYQYPIYRRPPEVVMIDMAACSPTGRGRKEWGKIDPVTHKLVPMPTRGEVRKGAYAGRNLELLWADDPIDTLFLDIQGSGRATLDDGTEVWIEYDGKNGQKYAGPARLLRARGLLPRGKGTMQGIRDEFRAHMDQFDEITDGNESMVFFKLGSEPGAVGSQHVMLTPRRSAAVDRNFIAASTPLWVDTHAPRATGRGVEPWRHLVIAQDTGGNIKGAVRADLYWGPDASDGEVAGRLGGKGQYWALLPKRVKPKR